MEDKKADLQQLGSRIRDNIKELVESDREEQIQEDLRQRLVLSLLFVVPLLLVSWLMDPGAAGIALQFALLVPILVVNVRVFIDGFSAVRSRRPEKNTLAAIGTILAMLLLQFAASGIFLTTMALCRWSEAYVRCKLDDHLRKLIEAEPEDPQLDPGEIVEAGAGEVIPADGIIVEGETVIEEELITGEVVPAEKGAGEPVFAGTRNLRAPIRVEVSRCGRETAIARIIDHITASVATSPPIAKRAERAARLLVLVVVVLAALAGGIWAASGAGAVDAALTAVTILIIASPYAFSVGVPMSIHGATVRAAGNGMLIRSADILELARDINTIAMNKTGTVTGGEPQISDVIPLSGGFSLRLAGALEQNSRHPVSRVIAEAARKECGGSPEARVAGPSADTKECGGLPEAVDAKASGGLPEARVAGPSADTKECGGLPEAVDAKASGGLPEAVDAKASGGLPEARVAGPSADTKECGGLPEAVDAKASGGLPEATDVTIVQGRGVRAAVDGKVYLAGNALFLQENGIFTDLPEAEPLYAQGKSLVFYATESRVIGIIALRDGPTADSLKAISRIEGMGIDTVMITGDSPATAEAICSEVGIDHTFAGIRTEEKAQVIRELRERDEKLVAMVGDGMDDAEAIAAADMGIAIGAGPEIGTMPADVILIENDLMDVVRAITLSRKTIRYIRQDIMFAYIYNILAIAAAASILVQLAGPVLAPVIAALCMCGSQILVVASTMRLKTARL